MRLCLLLLPLFAVLGSARAGERGLPAQQGILNFGQVSTNLYRGARPDAAAIQNLQCLGVKSIISLREPDKLWAVEAAAATARGVLCTNIPLRGLGRPTDKEIRKVLATMQALPAPVFIHCEHGCDRTGTVIACYRILNEKWSGEAALREAERYGLSRFERGMRAFVRDFAKSAR